MVAGNQDSELNEQMLSALLAIYGKPRVVSFMEAMYPGLVDQIGHAINSVQMRPKQPQPFAFEVDTPDVVYVPWTDGHSVGFLCTHKATGKVEIIHLSPSVDYSTPDVFLYQGDPIDPQAEHHYLVHEAEYEVEAHNG